MIKILSIILVVILGLGLGYYFLPYPGYVIYVEIYKDNPSVRTNILNYLNQFGENSGFKKVNDCSNNSCPVLRDVFNVKNGILANKDKKLINQYLSDQKISDIKIRSVRKDFLFPNGL